MTRSIISELLTLRKVLRLCRLRNSSAILATLKKLTDIDTDIDIRHKTGHLGDVVPTSQLGCFADVTLFLLHFNDRLSSQVITESTEPIFAKFVVLIVLWERLIMRTFI